MDERRVNERRPDQRRPWFGPKRVGYGLRPQTWQGRVVTLALVAVIVLVAVLAALLAGH